MDRETDPQMSCLTLESRMKETSEDVEARTLDVDLISLEAHTMIEKAHELSPNRASVLPEPALTPELRRLTNEKA